MQNNHGGKRAGAGRPAKIENGIRYQVTVSPADSDKLLKIGEGSISYGIRAVMQGGQCPECGAHINAEDLVNHQEEHGQENVHE